MMDDLSGELQKYRILRNYNAYQLAGLFIFFLIPFVLATNRYYGTYTVYGTGDTVINTVQGHFGPEHGKRRWNIECLDGEAVIGISDLQDDFQKLVQVWCKFMFPYKEYTNGLYPYYPDCFVNNYTYQFYCYSPKFHDASVNSFVAGFWDNDGQFFLYRKAVDDKSPYKCCKTPPSYYVDYQSCYYMPTRDQYGEYYDATYIILIKCATGYAMTGLAKKMSPFTGDYHIEWIQCCRIGFGALPVFSPSEILKIAHSYSSYANATIPGRPSAEYASQYGGANLGPRGIEKDKADSTDRLARKARSLTDLEGAATTNEQDESHEILFANGDLNEEDEVDEHGILAPSSLFHQ